MLQRQHRRCRIHIVNAVRSPIAHQTLGTAIVEDRRAITGANEATGLRTGSVVVNDNGVVVVVVRDCGGVAERMLGEKIVAPRCSRRTGRVGRASSAIPSDKNVAALMVDEVIGAVRWNDGGRGRSAVRADYLGHVLGKAREEFGVEGTVIGLRKQKQILLRIRIHFIIYLGQNKL